MKNKQKLSKMEKFMLREFDTNMRTANRFLNDEEYSLPCGSSPGMFLSELFQSYNDPLEADPFSIFAAGEDDLLAAQKISALSREKDRGRCMINLGRRTCDVNGRRYAIFDTAYIQIKVKKPDICCSLFLDTENVFAAGVFADTLDQCFMMIEAADNDRICVPLNEFRLLSVNGKRCGMETGFVIEYVKSVYASIYDNIICGAELNLIKRALWINSYNNKPKRR